MLDPSPTKALRRTGVLLAMFAVLASTAPAETLAPRMSLDDASAILGLQASLSESKRSLVLHRHDRVGTLTENSREFDIDSARIFLGEPVERVAGQYMMSRIDYERRLLPLFRPDLVPHPPRIPHLIVLDPGHGGWDPGAENRELGLKEKILTLDVAERLRTLLVANGWTVILTRTSDTALAPTKDADLDKRSAVAVSAGADLFLSIHFDSDAAGALQGSEIFSLTPEHQISTDAWERTHLHPSIPATDYPGNRQDPWNSLLAHCLFRELPRSLHTNDLGERIAHWRVLEGLTCPGVLVEPAYIAKKSEALRAASPEFRQQVAEALFRGLTAYAAVIGGLTPAPASK